MSQLHVWAIVRLLPNMQRAIVNRFRRRGDAENYIHLLRRYNPDGNFLIMFDPPPEEQHPESSTQKNLHVNDAKPRSLQNRGANKPV